MNILSNEPLQERNSLSLIATGQAVLEVITERDLVDGLVWAQANQKTVTILGAGSNVVLAGDISGLVIVQKSCGIKIVSEDEQSVLLRVAAGENWHEFVGWCLERSYYGLENLALIPGTVGAAPIQNIGAYGVEIKSFVHTIHTRRITDQAVVELSPIECKFSYRDSVFKGELRDQLAITSVELRLQKNPNVQVAYPALAKELESKIGSTITAKDVFDAVVSIRSSKLPDPAREPNAGSFFKNPVLTEVDAQKLTSAHADIPAYPQADGSVKFPAAWFIDQCGWKAYREKGVGVHPEHALVLVNYGSNNGRELLKLADSIARSVKERFAVELEQEPRTYGDGHG
ncbi:MAG: UDP-N-acetylmuramate dehydrogenase [Halioglobus sp.]